MLVHNEAFVEHAQWYDFDRRRFTKANARVFTVRLRRKTTLIGVLVYRFARDVGMAVHVIHWTKNVRHTERRIDFHKFPNTFASYRMRHELSPVVHIQGDTKVTILSVRLFTLADQPKIPLGNTSGWGHKLVNLAPHPNS